jgi:hypothetical protein
MAAGKNALAPRTPLCAAGGCGLVQRPGRELQRRNRIAGSAQRVGPPIPASTKKREAFIALGLHGAQRRPRLAEHR